MQQVLEKLSDFERDGFAVFKAVVPSPQIEQLIDIVEETRKEKSVPGLRNLLKRCSALRTFASSGVVFKIAQQILGGTPLPVRAILFDKTPASNWYVTWHQDLSIPVQNKVDLEGYGPWSTKDEILHVQPPAAILEKMVSLRIHLDACSEANGAIKFIAGSHRRGILEPEQIGSFRDSHAAFVCPADRGDIIAMRPLILHSSSIAEVPGHRRVLHLEYAGTALPSGIEWAEA
ncbi:MAG: phytanoyl-CoA dioxygenase family protein [Candidatus Obscuribacterales bacterium]